MYLSISLLTMKKFQAIISFEMDEDFMSLVPPHRTYINYLLNKGIIDTYAVSIFMELLPEFCA